MATIYNDFMSHQLPPVAKSPLSFGSEPGIVTFLSPNLSLMPFSFLVGSQEVFQGSSGTWPSSSWHPEPQTESCQGQHAPKQPSSSQGALS